MSRLTDWFPEDGPQPELPGVYEVDPDACSPWYSYWDGHSWGWLTEKGPDEAVRSRSQASHPRCTWRGLAECPTHTAAQAATDKD